MSQNQPERNSTASSPASRNPARPADHLVADRVASLGNTNRTAADIPARSTATASDVVERRAAPRPMGFIALTAASPAAPTISTQCRGMTRPTSMAPASRHSTSPAHRPADPAGHGTSASRSGHRRRCCARSSARAMPIGVVPSLRGHIRLTWACTRRCSLGEPRPAASGPDSAAGTRVQQRARHTATLGPHFCRRCCRR